MCVFQNYCRGNAPRQRIHKVRVFKLLQRVHLGREHTRWVFPNYCRRNSPREKTLNVCIFNYGRGNAPLQRIYITCSFSNVRSFCNSLKIYIYVFSGEAYSLWNLLKIHQLHIMCFQTITNGMHLAKEHLKCLFSNNCKWNTPPQRIHNLCFFKILQMERAHEIYISLKSFCMLPFFRLSHPADSSISTVTNPISATSYFVRHEVEEWHVFF